MKRWRQERIKAEKRDAVHDKVRDKLGIELGDEANSSLKRRGCADLVAVEDLRWVSSGAVWTSWDLSCRCPTSEELGFARTPARAHSGFGILQRNRRGDEYWVLVSCLPECVWAQTGS